MNWTQCMRNNIPTIDCIEMVVQNIISFAIGLAAIAALFLVIYAGITFVISNGDKEKVESARKTLTYAIIGLIVIAMVFVIMKLIADLTGVTQIL